MMHWVILLREKQMLRPKKLYVMVTYNKPLCREIETYLCPKDVSNRINTASSNRVQDLHTNPKKWQVKCISQQMRPSTKGHNQRTRKEKNDQKN